jgi:diguanylate cyclase (GGDEF)-like protein
MNIWFNMSFIPVGKDEGDVLYCLYIMEINFKADSERLSNIDGSIASTVLEISLKLSGTDDFDGAMNDVIKDIRDICEAEHCCILPMDTHERSCYVLSEALSKDTKLISMKNYVDDAFYDIADSWEGTIAGSNCLIAKNDQDMEVVKERNPIWYDSLTGAGAKNIVLFPLKYHDELLGYIWAINFNAEMAPKIKETLELSTYVLGVELGNHLLLNKLKVLSSKDMLTGVMNRNEMNNYVDRICNSNESSDAGLKKSKRSVCVIFSDLNGLKTVNDEEGHQAGDILLKNAAKALCEIFDEREIFRAGGDEFTMIIPDMTEEVMNERIEQIRTVASRYEGLVFALGGCYVDDIKDIRLALKLADERMYEDKHKYYELHPEKKKR